MPDKAPSIRQQSPSPSLELEPLTTHVTISAFLRSLHVHNPLPSPPFPTPCNDLPRNCVRPNQTPALQPPIATMTSDKHKPTLTNIPLEVRHHIFEYVASHDTQPKKLLRYWFEKKEVREKTAELAAKNGGVGAPRVVYAGDQFEHEEFDMEDGEEWEDSGEDDSDEDGDEDGDEDSDEDGDEEEEEEEDEEEDGDDAVPTAAASLNAQPAGQANAAPAAQITASVGASLVAGASQGLSAALAAANAAMQTSMATVAALHTPTAPAVPAQVQGQAGDEEEGSDADMSEDGEEEDVDMDGEDEHEDGDEDADSDEEMEQDDDADFGAVAVQADSPSAPVVTAHGKWRHIPKVCAEGSWVS